MIARSHVAIGLAAWVCAAPLLHLAPFDPASLALAVAGSLLPDVDHPRSWLGRRLGPVSRGLAAMLGHRGVTHSALAAAGLAALRSHAGARRAAVAALAVGYLSHLAADMLTPQGLRLAWPLRRTWGVPLCRTGSRAEPAVVAALVCAMAWWALAHGAARAAALQLWRIAQP